MNILYLDFTDSSGNESPLKIKSSKKKEFVLRKVTLNTSGMMIFEKCEKKSEKPPQKKSIFHCFNYLCDPNSLFKKQIKSEISPEIDTKITQLPSAANVQHIRKIKKLGLHLLEFKHL